MTTNRNDMSLPRGLYAITDTGLIPDSRLIPTVEEALLGGARLVQFRDKRMAYPHRRELAEALNELCLRHRVPLIINDDIALAALVGAAGVHLGEDDPNPHQARRRLGSTAIIGVSCYNQLERARRLTALGADYLAFGSVYPSPTKPAARRADLQLLAMARRELELPIVAIGGITPANAPPLVAAGVDLLAVISSLWAAPDIRAAARAYQALYQT